MARQAPLELKIRKWACHCHRGDMKLSNRLQINHVDHDLGEKFNLNSFDLLPQAS